MAQENCSASMFQNVFLEIPNVPKGTVFAETVTITDSTSASKWKYFGEIEAVRNLITSSHLRPIYVPYLTSRSPTLVTRAHSI